MKKSLKKLLFILLTLLSVIFIVACGDKLSKKEVVEKFVENSKNIKSTDIAMTMKMEQKNSTNPAGVSMEMSGDLSIMLEPTLTMKMDLTVPFANNKLSMYVKDDYSYVQNPNDNQWIKQSNKGFGEQFAKLYAQSNSMYDFLMKNLDKIDLKSKDGNLVEIANIAKKELENMKPLFPSGSKYEIIVDKEILSELEDKMLDDFENIKVLSPPELCLLLLRRALFFNSLLSSLPTHCPPFSAVR